MPIARPPASIGTTSSEPGTKGVSEVSPCCAMSSAMPSDSSRLRRICSAPGSSGRGATCQWPSWAVQQYGKRISPAAESMLRIITA